MNSRQSLLVLAPGDALCLQTINDRLNPSRNNRGSTADDPILGSSNDSSVVWLRRVCNPSIIGQGDSLTSDPSQICCYRQSSIVNKRYNSRSAMADSKSVFSSHIWTKRSNFRPGTLLVGLVVFALALPSAIDAASVFLFGMNGSRTEALAEADGDATEVVDCARGRTAADATVASVTMVAWVNNIFSNVLVRSWDGKIGDVFAFVVVKRMEKKEGSVRRAGRQDT